jgi:hypothetical protein
LVDTHDVFRRAGGDDVAAGVAAFGAEVYEVVGGFDNVEVVFDNDERAARKCRNLVVPCCLCKNKAWRGNAARSD